MADLWGDDARAILRHNDSGLLRAVQIEDVEGVANTESIANTNGVDLIFVGPRACQSSEQPHLGDIESETAIMML